MRVVELFAGPGGSSEGLKMVAPQADLVGIELDESAAATATAAGHHRVVADVTTLDPAEFGPVDGLIASPPCPPFSVASGGKGTRDIPEVQGLVTRYMNGLGGFTVEPAWNDARSPLTAEPMRWIKALNPTWIMMEQVPAVLPLWEFYGEVLRELGYYTWTGVLKAEQYGVPQTRKRAFLVAHKERQPAAPPATHSAYHPRNKSKRDPGVLPYVTIGEALGWTDDGRVLRSNYGTGGDARARGIRTLDQPAAMVTGKVSNNRWVNNQSGTEYDLADQLDQPATVVAGRDIVTFRGANANRFNGATKSRNDGLRVTVQEAGILQGFPARGYYSFMESITRDEAMVAALAAGWVEVDPPSGQVWVTRGPGGATQRRLTMGSNCNGYRVISCKVGGYKWQFKLHRLIWTAEHGIIPEGMTVDHINGDKTDNRISNLQLLTGSDNAKKAHADGAMSYDGRRKIPVEQYDLIVEAATVNGETHRVIAERYGVTRGRISQILREHGYPWSGLKTKQYQQVGNAVPPPLAAAVLRPLVGQGNDDD